MVIRPRKPKGFSKKPMEVKDVKKKYMGQGMKWASRVGMLANKAQKS